MTDITIREYIQELASSKPAPGGGSAAAYTTAIAISLGLMSINVSKNRKRFSQLAEDEQHKVFKIIEWLEKLIQECYVLEKNDAEAFNNYMSCYKSGTDEQKQEASIKCYNVPYKLLQVNLRVASLIMALKPYIVSTITSDFKMALELTITNLKSCLLNMDINVKYIEDKDINEECLKGHQEVEKIIETIIKCKEEI